MLPSIPNRFRIFLRSKNIGIHGTKSVIKQNSPEFSSNRSALSAIWQGIQQDPQRPKSNVRRYIIKICT